MTRNIFLKWISYWVSWANHTDIFKNLWPSGFIIIASYTISPSGTNLISHKYTYGFIFDRCGCGLAALILIIYECKYPHRDDNRHPTVQLNNVACLTRDSNTHDFTKQVTSYLCILTDCAPGMMKKLCIQQKHHLITISHGHFGARLSPLWLNKLPLIDLIRPLLTN